MHAQAAPTEIVAHFHDPLEARIACGRLHAEGIAAALGNEQTALANWEWRLAIGGIVLRVAPGDADHARAVLAAVDAGDYTLAADDEDTHDGTHDHAHADAHANPPGPLLHEHESPSSRLAWLALFLLQLPLPWRRPRHARGYRRV